MIAALLLLVCPVWDSHRIDPGPVLVQDSAHDAASFLAWHAERIAQPQNDWEAQAHNAWVYLQAGALEEARRAVEEMESLRPGDPDAARFRIRIDSWNASLRGRAALSARHWLASHPDQPTELREAVRRDLAFLEDEKARNDGVAASQGRARFAPWAVLLLLGGGLRLGFRKFP